MSKITVPNKDDFFWDGENGFLDVDDWNVLETAIDEHNIKNVVEFGSGISTRLFCMKGLNVTSYEQFDRFIKRLKDEGVSADIRKWFDPDPRKYYPTDMVFIDGPWCDGSDPKYLNREMSYIRALAMEPRVIIAHDTDRDEEQVWIKKHLIANGYKLTVKGRLIEVFIK
jgi:hypothetical protein